MVLIAMEILVNKLFLKSLRQQAGWSPKWSVLKFAGIKILVYSLICDRYLGPQRTLAKASKLPFEHACNIICAQQALDNAIPTASASTRTRAEYTTASTSDASWDACTPLLL